MINGSPVHELNATYSFCTTVRLSPVFAVVASERGWSIRMTTGTLQCLLSLPAEYQRGTESLQEVLRDQVCRRIQKTRRGGPPLAKRVPSPQAYLRRLSVSP